MTRRAVFFDRDDTLMANVPYLADPAAVRIFKEAPAALQALTEHGFDLFLVSNQSGIGRGLITHDQLNAVTAEFIRQLGKPFFREIYHSYSDPSALKDDWATRKPSPLLVFQAARQHGLDLRRSFFVGDRIADVLCGRNAGCRTVLVRTGTNVKEWDQAGRLADAVVSSLAEAVDWILKAS